MEVSSRLAALLLLLSADDVQVFEAFLLSIAEPGLPHAQVGRWLRQHVLLRHELTHCALTRTSPVLVGAGDADTATDPDDTLLGTGLRCRHREAVHKDTVAEDSGLAVACNMARA